MPFKFTRLQTSIDDMEYFKATELSFDRLRVPMLIKNRLPLDALELSIF